MIEFIWEFHLTNENKSEQMKYRIKNTKTTLRVIAIYQILGGVLGIGLMGWLLLRTGQINGPLLFIYFLAIFLFGLSVHSGNLLLKKDSLKTGLIFSLVLQTLQVLAFGIGSYTYMFFSGARASIGIDFTNGFEFGFKASFSEFSFIINASEPEYFININLIAILVLSVLIDIYEELYKRKPDEKPEVTEPEQSDDLDFKESNEQSSIKDH
ncbi:MAG: hypothetical protein N4A71_22515 [Carboxylicivirga sp.]|jgi:hypothetical protein|nr:hypothetical protein [Carboxylicivirga sp.]